MTIKCVTLFCLWIAIFCLVNVIFAQRQIASSQNPFPQQRPNLQPIQLQAQQRSAFTERRFRTRPQQNPLTHRPLPRFASSRISLLRRSPPFRPGISNRKPARITLDPQTNLSKEISENSPKLRTQANAEFQRPTVSPQQRLPLPRQPANSASIPPRRPRIEVAPSRGPLRRLPPPSVQASRRQPVPQPQSVRPRAPPSQQSPTRPPSSLQNPSSLPPQFVRAPVASSAQRSSPPASSVARPTFQQQARQPPPAPQTFSQQSRVAHPSPISRPPQQQFFRPPPAAPQTFVPQPRLTPPSPPLLFRPSPMQPPRPQPPPSIQPQRRQLITPDQRFTRPDQARVLPLSAPVGPPRQAPLMSNSIADPPPSPSLPIPRSRPSAHPPGFLPPSNSIIDELNHSNNFMEVARRLQLRRVIRGSARK